MTADEENTWRALKDQVPVVTSWWCKFGIHKWTKWSEPYYRGSYLYQNSACIHCNTLRHKDVNSVAVSK